MVSIDDFRIFAIGDKWRHAQYFNDTLRGLCNMQIEILDMKDDSFSFYWKGGGGHMLIHYYEFKDEIFRKLKDLLWFKHKMFGHPLPKGFDRLTKQEKC